MSRIAHNNKKLTLRSLFGIRARLVLLALILVGPLMADRVRVLEDFRDKQLTRVNHDFARLAENSADAQSELMLSIEAVLRASAYIHASAAQAGRGCTILRDSLRRDLPWIKSIAVIGKDGSVICSTADDMYNLNLADRDYFKQALQTQGFVVSDFMLSRRDGKPIIMTAFPISSIQAGQDAVMIAAVNLDWMSKSMSNLGGRFGVSATLVDSAGTILAAPADQAERIGAKLDTEMLQAAMWATVGRSPATAQVPLAAVDGARRMLTVARIAGTPARLVVTVDEAAIAASTNQEIRSAYLQLALVCLFVLLGALAVAERIIIKPIDAITDAARRFGEGDWSARPAGIRLPAEFIPLARAFTRMTAQLRDREREMLAANDRLAVMASSDMLSGLANRRGFQSRLDFEWAKAQQTGGNLAVMMIDVDHFKAFNDTYGHLQGDACLGRIGDVLAAVALDTNGFAGRYGGEEFCMLLPGATVASGHRAGEAVRAAVQALAIPHTAGIAQRVTVSVGVASIAPHAAGLASDLVEAADAALYVAKHRGRNMVAGHGLVAVEGVPLALAG